MAARESVVGAASLVGAVAADLVGAPAVLAQQRR